MLIHWFSLSATRRFTIGFVISFTLSFAWILFLCLVSFRCGNIAPRLISLWLINLPTYGVMCTLFWSTAVGILCGSMHKEVWKKNLDMRWKRILLGILVFSSFSISLEDKLQPRRMQVYEIKQLCLLAPTYLGIQEKISASTFECEKLTAQELDFKSALEVNSVEALFIKSNIVAWVELVVQVYYSMFIGIFIWYVIVVMSSRKIKPEQTLQISAISVLFSLWIPLRIYQKFFQSRYLSCDIFSSSVMTGAILTAGLFLILIVKKRKVDLDIVLKIIGFFSVIIGAILAATPDSLNFIADVLFRLRLSQFIAIYIVGLSMMLVLGHHLTNYTFKHHIHVEGLDISQLTPQQEVFYRQVDALIRQRLKTNRVIGPDEIADEIGIGRATFYAKFKNCFGMPPASYIRAVRLETAAQLLEKDVGTITQIAKQVGYNSTAQFSRAFKDKYGVSPKKYAKKAGTKSKEK